MLTAHAAQLLPLTLPGSARGRGNMFSCGSSRWRMRSHSIHCEPNKPSPCCLATLIVHRQPSTVATASTSRATAARCGAACTVNIEGHNIEFGAILAADRRSGAGFWRRLRRRHHAGRGDDWPRDLCRSSTRGLRVWGAIDWLITPGPTDWNKVLKTAEKTGNLNDMLTAAMQLRMPLAEQNAMLKRREHVRDWLPPNSGIWSNQCSECGEKRPEGDAALQVANPVNPAVVPSEPLKFWSVGNAGGIAFIVAGAAILLGAVAARLLALFA